MSGGVALQMDALDVTSGAWEDLKQEVLADDPDAVAAVFIGAADKPGIFMSGSCTSTHDCLECISCEGGCGDCGCISPGVVT